MLRNLIILQGSTIEVVGILWGFLWLTYLWLDSHVVLVNILESCPKWKNAIKTENVTENVPSYSILSVWLLWGADFSLFWCAHPPWGSQPAHFISAAGWGSATHSTCWRGFSGAVFCAHPEHEAQYVCPSLSSWFVTFISSCILIYISVLIPLLHRSGLY